MPEKFGTARYSPPGDWVQATMALSVVGIQFRQGAVAHFCGAVAAAERKGLWYGIELRRDPGNAHDANAIQVIGVAEVKPWLRSVRRQDWHIGFIDRDTAAEIVADFTSRGVPIAGQLYSIYRGIEGFVDIKVIVLAPPGNSQSKRARRKRES